MILFLIVLAVVLYWVEKYSLVHGLDHVSFKTSLDKMLIEPDEPFTWTMTVKNDKWMMVPYLRVMELVPRGLRFAETDQEVEQKGIMGLRSVLYLAGRQKTELVRTVKLSERGRYFFRGSSRRMRPSFSDCRTFSFSSVSFRKRLPAVLLPASRISFPFHTDADAAAGISQ